MNKNTKFTNPMKVITGPNTRWSYANVWEPKSINGGAPKYSVSLIIPKSDTKTVAKIQAAIEAAYRDGEAKLRGNGKSVPALSAIKTPLRDGDTERPDDHAYAGAYFVNANATSAPGIVDADRQPILTRSEVYFGVYGRASIEDFLKAFAAMPDELTEFTLESWHGLVDYGTVYAVDDIRFTFKNGQEVKA